MNSGVDFFLRLDILADNADRALRRLGKRVDENKKKADSFASKFQAGMKKVKEKIQSVAKAIFSLKGAFLAVGIAALLRGITHAGIESHMAIAKLKGVLQATSEAVGWNFRQIDELTDRYAQLTTVAKEQWMEIAAIAGTFLSITQKTYPRVIALAGDLAVLLGNSAQSLTVMLGKMMEDPNLLAGARRVGISISQSTVDVARRLHELGHIQAYQDIVTGVIADQAKGIAQNAAKGAGRIMQFQGSLKTLVNTASRITLELIAPWLVPWRNRLDYIEKWLRRNPTVVKGIISAILGKIKQAFNWIKDKITELYNAIKTAMSMIIEMLNIIKEHGLVAITKGWKAWTTDVVVTKNELKETEKSTGNIFSRITNAIGIADQLAQKGGLINYLVYGPGEGEALANGERILALYDKAQKIIDQINTKPKESKQDRADREGRELKDIAGLDVNKFTEPLTQGLQAQASIIDHLFTHFSSILSTKIQQGVSMFVSGLGRGRKAFKTFLADLKNQLITSAILELLSYIGNLISGGAGTALLGGGGLFKGLFGGGSKTSTTQSLNIPEMNFNPNINLSYQPGGYGEPGMVRAMVNGHEQVIVPHTANKRRHTPRTYTERL